MNKRLQSVMSMLKPKVKAFGFNHKELKGLAAKIAENLTSEEDASEEDVNAEIEKAIEAVLPVLELGRSYANRVINDTMNGNEENDDDDDVQSKSNKKSKSSAKKSEDETDAMKILLDEIKGLRSEIAEIKGEKVTDARRSKLESLLKDTGVFGSRMMKSFSRMKFENDDEFDEFFADVEEDLKSFNQERANAGLEKLGKPIVASGGKKDEKKDVLSDDDIKAIAGTKA